MKTLCLTGANNPQLKAIKKLATDNTAYKREGLIWLEGVHLCEAYCDAAGKAAKAADKAAGRTPAGVEAAGLLRLCKVVVSEAAWPLWAERLATLKARFPALVANDVSALVLVLPDRLMCDWSPLPITQAQAGIGFVLQASGGAPSSSLSSLNRACKTVVLDRVQDAGNVGSILRSCAVFGVEQVVALSGTAALWSPKVLRAAMGAHFALTLVEDVEEEAIPKDWPLMVTSSHQGEDLYALQAQARDRVGPSQEEHHDPLPPLAGVWVFGHEGQGVRALLMQRAQQIVRIRQAGQESLNVAAAAAVCLYAGAQEGR